MWASSGTVSPSSNISPSAIPSTFCGRDARERYGKGGPFLFGVFTNADAMYAPVATRFRTYGVDLGRFGDDGTAAAYAETILTLPAMAEWTEGARAEIWERATA